MGVTNSTHFRSCWELSIWFQTLNALKMLQSMGEERPRHSSAYENCLLWAMLAEPQQPGSMPLGVPRGEASCSRGQCWVLDHQGLEIREVSVESLGSPAPQILFAIATHSQPEKSWARVKFSPPSSSSLCLLWPGFPSETEEESVLGQLGSLSEPPQPLDCFRLLCWCCWGKSQRA